MKPTDEDRISPERLFSAEAFADLLHDWSNALVAYVKSVPDGPVTQWATPATLNRLIRADLSEDGVGDEVVLEQFRRSVLPWCQHHFHTRVAGHQVGCPLPIAVVADLAASLLNQGMGIWEVAPGPVMLTQKVVGWLLDAAGFGAGSDGILTTGGTESNLTAILAARSRVFGPQVREEGLRREDRPVILTSELAHYSIARAAGVAGIGRRNVRAVPVDDRLRLDVRALEAALEQAVDAGERVVAVAATAGSTAAGSFDPLEEIAALCRQFGVWFHVDGAHGASLLFARQSRKLLAAVELTDSLTWDPHKMLFVPSALGALLVADGRDLEAVFDERPSYLFDDRAKDFPRWNFTRKNLRCTQRFDALRLWAAFQMHGRRTIADLLERTVALAHGLWERIEEDPRFVSLIEPSFNIVCFRFVSPQMPEDAVDKLNMDIRTKLLRDGTAWITTTVVKGRLFLRMALMNPQATGNDMEAIVRLAREAGEHLLREA